MAPANGKFSDGSIWDFWLEDSRTWAASTVYYANQLVQPVTPNGLAYQANRIGDSYSAWKAALPVIVGDKVEPTTYTGFYYEATSVSGTHVLTGTTEPAWPSNEGQTVIESADAATVTTTTPETPGDPTTGGYTDDDPYTGLPWRGGRRFGL